MSMDLSRFILILGFFLAGFMSATYLVLSTPALQWPGLDEVLWPAARTLLVLSTIATLVPFIPIGKRALKVSPHKRSFAFGYFFVVSYTFIGIGATLLMPFRAASGI